VKKKPVKKVVEPVELLTVVTFRAEMAKLMAFIPGTKEYINRVEVERLAQEKTDAGKVS
jgi:hypothetical protein